MGPIWIILTSITTASIISGIFILINGWNDRRMKKKEIIFNMAFKIAKDRQDLMKSLSEKTNQTTIFPDLVFNTETYYKWLLNLYNEGKLPDEAHKISKDHIKELRIL